MVQNFGWQEQGEQLKVYTDADWAGCRKTRKSTSGGLVMKGDHCIKFWSNTQASILLSTAEAELVAMVKGVCEAKGVAAIMKDMTGKDHGAIGVYTDASAAIGMVQRKGAGKVRHIDVGMLWIQQHCRSGKVDVKKVAFKSNPADIFTKAVPAEVMWGHMGAIGFESREGRSEAAVELVKT